ncbi:gamete antigen 27/25, putative [Plasmodium relictum]|uniref:Gamete antigen 27/25, putative n=1 Tax=Plasmodium relictum TaxID=85471 RepID=A0A1J1GK82_PLARL|nr:gamete antigen 27/25, putative [Plasmodium relictum]CRG84811.1 gamete antigen 27/25, putative [Plasmodium relictum]
MIKKYIFLLNYIILIGHIFEYNILEIKAAESSQASSSKEVEITKDRIFVYFREDCRLEFHMTIYCLDHVLGFKNLSDIKKSVTDLDAIKKEIVDSARKYYQVVMEDDEALERMANRISGRLFNLRSEILTTMDYYSLLKNIFWAEQRAMEDIFIELNEKDDIAQKTEVIGRISSIKSIFEKYLRLININLSGQQIQNTAERIQELLGELCGISIKYTRPASLDFESHALLC